MNEAEFLKRKFQEYYLKHKINSVPCIETREFGIGDFRKKIVRRHLHFSSADELNSFLRKEAPLYISYSAAYYRTPSARPMGNKGFLGSDLVYEFDADELGLDCKEEHDFWYCKKCGNSGKGSVKNCSNCGSAVEQYQFVCEKCLGETKKQMLKLIEVLDGELNIFEQASINFSGSAGYHLHIRSEKIRQLSSAARLELVDYLTLAGFSPEISIADFSQKMLTCARPQALKGARARVMNRVIEFISNAKPDELAAYGGIRLSKAKYMYEKRAKIIEKMKQGILTYLPGSKAASVKFWQNLIEYAKDYESLKLDRQTSIDIHKIVRVPDTLHGSTGLIAKTVPLEDFKEFMPLKQAIAFSDRQIKVFINKAPKFKLGAECFGPYENEQAILPEYVAIYLIGKGLASLRD